MSQAAEFGGSPAAMPVGWAEEPRVAVRIASASAPDRANLIVRDTLDRPLLAVVEGGETMLECA